MEIKNDAMVGIEYVLTLDSGQEMDRSAAGKPLQFIFGKGQMMPGVEKELAGKVEGDTMEFAVEPEDGFGLPDPQLIRDVPRDRFPQDADLQPGATFQAVGPSGSFPVIIQSVEGDNVTVDLNNPLCGERLHFQLKVVEVRQATQEELTAATGCASCGCDSCGTC